MLSWIKKSPPDENVSLEALRAALDNADTVVIGAGAGLSTSAGFVYNGERLEKYFPDFIAKYGFNDMYSGGFYPFKTPEEHWAYWSRYIYINRYMSPPNPLYNELFELVRSKDYFVLTTNVDHCFQKSGFDKKRLFYTQGDYGLFQCAEPCTYETYENHEILCKMLISQGFSIAEDGTLVTPEASALRMTVPTELIPRCPHCGKPLTMNLRSDDNFVEDAGWNIHADYYSEFLQKRRETRTLFLELGVGFNTPAIIKYNFWRLTKQWSHATYACLNFGDAYAPDDIRSKSICINGDIRDILSRI